MKSLKLFFWLLPALLVIGLPAAAQRYKGLQRPLPAALVAKYEYDFGINLEKYRGAVQGALIGQLAGASWQAQLRKQHLNQWPAPLAALPEWQSSLLNEGLAQPSLYGQLPLMQAFLKHGANCTREEIGRFWAVYKFPLSHGALVARHHQQMGILSPYSGHWQHNSHSDDASFLPLAAFMGLAAPGLPSAAQEMAWRSGHLMAYGDGAYAGVYLAAAYTQAFLSDSPYEVAQAALATLPPRAELRMQLEEIIRLYQKDSVNWQPAARLLTETESRIRCPLFKASVAPESDAVIETGAFVIGLLYGRKDPVQTLRIAMACSPNGQAAAAAAGGVLGCMLGLDPMRTALGALPDDRSYFGGTDVTIADYDAHLRKILNNVLELKLGYTITRGAIRKIILPKDSSRTLIPEQAGGRSLADLPQVRIKQIKQESYRITLTAEVSRSVKYIQWYTGDLSIKNGRTIEHLYPRSGPHQVVCYVADEKGNATAAVATVYPGWDREKKEPVGLSQITFDKPHDGHFVNQHQIQSLYFKLADPARQVTRIVVMHNGDSFTTIKPTANFFSITLRHPGKHYFTLKAMNRYDEVVTSAFTWRETIFTVPAKAPGVNLLVDTLHWQNCTVQPLLYRAQSAGDAWPGQRGQLSLCHDGEYLYMRVVVNEPPMPEPRNYKPADSTWQALQPGSITLFTEPGLRRQPGKLARVNSYTFGYQNGYPGLNPQQKATGAESRLVPLRDGYAVYARIPLNQLDLAPGRKLQGFNCMVTSRPANLTYGLSLFPTAGYVHTDATELGIIVLQK